MEKTLKCMSSLSLALLLWIALSSAGWTSTFQNGDFETGDFTGWSGEIGYYDNGGIVSTPVDPDASPYFDLIHTPDPDFSWVANLSLDDTYYHNTLYQDFTLDSLNGPGWTMYIKFYASWQPSDGTQDGVSIVLEGESPPYSLDLLDGVSDTDLMAGTWIIQDITAFAQNYGGEDVELAFSIWDVDFDTSDTLTIDNISFEQQAPVPVPPSIILLGFGIIGVSGMSRRRKNKALNH